MSGTWVSLEPFPGDLMRRAAMDADGISVVSVRKGGEVEVRISAGGIGLSVSMSASDAALLAAELERAASVARGACRQRIPLPEVRDSSLGEFDELVTGAGA